MGQYRRCFSSGVRDYVFWCIMRRRWSWSGLGDVYTLICELIETWQFYPWFVEIGAVICGVTVQFLLLSTVVDDDPLHCWFFLAPISPFLLVGVQEGIRDLFGACLVAEIIEVRTLLFFDLWLRLLVFFLFWGAHNIEIYISAWSGAIYIEICVLRGNILKGQLSKEWSNLVWLLGGTFITYYSVMMILIFSWLLDNFYWIFL